jgi:hypothetical protein
MGYVTPTRERRGVALVARQKGGSPGKGHYPTAGCFVPKGERESGLQHDNG